MLSIREAVQKYNLLASEKINIAKPQEVLKKKFQEAIEEASPCFRDSLPDDIMEVFRFLTSQNLSDETSNNGNSEKPKFKGIWKDVTEKLMAEGMTKEAYKTLDLRFRSQEVFHLKKKGLILKMENDLVKLVSGTPTFRAKASNGNGTKSDLKPTVSLKISKNLASLPLESQIEILNSQISDLESRKAFLQLQIFENSLEDLNQKFQSEKELSQALINSGLQDVDFSMPMTMAAA